MPIKLDLAGKEWNSKMLNLLKMNVFIVLIFLGAVSFVRSSEMANQDVFASSQIKKKYRNDILRQIRKQLPSEFKGCPVVVENITLLRRDYKDSGVAEEWTVNVCREKRAYFVEEDSLKGLHYIAIPKEKRLSKEKELWDADKKTWREILFYVDEIDAMELKGKGTESSPNTVADSDHKESKSQ